MHDVFGVKLWMWHMYRLAGNGDWFIVRRGERVRLPDGAGDGHGDFHCLCSLCYREVIYCAEMAGISKSNISGEDGREKFRELGLDVEDFGSE